MKKILIIILILIVLITISLIIRAKTAYRAPESNSEISYNKYLHNFPFMPCREYFSA